MKPNKIEIPEDIINELKIDSSSPLQISVNNQKIVIKSSQNETESQPVILRWFLIPSIIASIIFLGYLIYNKTPLINMTGKNSIASMVIILGSISGICSFAFFSSEIRKKNARRKKIFIGEISSPLCSHLQ